MNSFTSYAAAAALAASVLFGSITPAPAVYAQPLVPASAAPAPSPSESGAARVTWAVRPADATGADGRAWIEWAGDPGVERSEHLVVSNYGDEEIEFRLTAADGYFTDKGRFNMLPSDRASTDAGTWISLPASVTVPAGDSQNVPFTIAIPQDATPGDHPAGVAASIVSPGGGTVGVESRVGFRVMTRVSGELRAELSTAISGSYTGSVNPFESGEVDIAYDLTNTGNTRVCTQPVISVAGPFGIAAAQRSGEEIIDIAPGETRSGTVHVSSAAPLLWYDVQIDAAPVAVTADLDTGAAPTASAHAVVAAPPWPQLVALALAGGLFAWYLWQRRRTQAKTARLVEVARAEARAEARHSEGDEVDAEPSLAAAAAAPTRLSLRRDASTTARVLIAVIAGTTALAAWGLSDTSPAQAADPVPDRGSAIVMEVEISPAPSVTSPASAEPSSSNPDNGTLPATGGGFDPGYLVAAGVLLGIGAAFVLHHRRASERSEL
ncbi:hypothetical protein [uncultured Microbacterium sp.]|uniref:hypothetical protein n=1 Tax=uncultured Microbacterium sp. TaxID=191216 RepID=UPI0035CA3829